MSLVDFTPSTVARVAGLLEDAQAGLGAIEEAFLEAYPPRARHFVVAWQGYETAAAKAYRGLNAGPWVIGPMSTKGKVVDKSGTKGVGPSMSNPGTGEWLKWKYCQVDPGQWRMEPTEGVRAAMREAWGDEYASPEAMAKKVLDLAADAWLESHGEVVIYENRTNPRDFGIRLAGGEALGPEFHQHVTRAWGGSPAAWALHRKGQLAEATVMKGGGVLQFIKERDGLT